MERLRRYIKYTSIALLTIPLLLVLVLAFLTATDVTGRFFGHPIRGSYQISEILQIALICLAWPFTTAGVGHVSLDLVVSKFPNWLQNKIDIFTHSLSLVVFAVITWQGVLLVQRCADLGDLVPIISLPLYPFLVVIPVGAFANCFVLFSQIRDLLVKQGEGKDLKQWRRRQ